MSRREEMGMRRMALGRRMRGWGRGRRGRVWRMEVEDGGSDIVWSVRREWVVVCLFVVWFLVGITGRPLKYADMSLGSQNSDNLIAIVEFEIELLFKEGKALGWIVVLMLMLRLC